MKYALFAGHNYYPRGGAEDFKHGSDDIEELKELYIRNADRWSIKEGSYSDPWGHIASLDTMEIILWAGDKKIWRDNEEDAIWG